jgi:hypothetical protein
MNRERSRSNKQNGKPGANTALQGSTFSGFLFFLGVVVAAVALFPRASLAVGTGQMTTREVMALGAGAVHCKFAPFVAEEPNVPANDVAKNLAIEAKAAI